MVKAKKSDREKRKKEILKKKASGVIPLKSTIPKPTRAKIASNENASNNVGGNGGNGDSVGTSLSITTTAIKHVANSDPNHPVNQLYASIEHIKSFLDEIKSKMPLNQQIAVSRDIMDIHKTLAGVIRIWGELMDKYADQDDGKDLYLENIKMQSALLIQFVMGWDCDCCGRLFKKELKDVLGDMGTYKVTIQGSS